MVVYLLVAILVSWKNFEDVLVYIVVNKSVMTKSEMNKKVGKTSSWRAFIFDFAQIQRKQPGSLQFCQLLLFWWGSLPRLWEKEEESF